VVTRERARAGAGDEINDDMGLLTTEVCHGRRHVYEGGGQPTGHRPV